jgi:dephospho-CoA kinase
MAFASSAFASTAFVTDDAVIADAVIVRGQRKGSKRKRYDEELDRDAFGEWLRMDAKRRREEEAIMHLLFD